MNIERLQAIRDYIEDNPEKLNMGDFFQSCGTIACIAGHAIIMFGNIRLLQSNSEQAANLLGLEPHLAHRLFFGGGQHLFHLSDITASQAIATLDHLITTGEVEWQIIQCQASEDFVGAVTCE